MGILGWSKGKRKDIAPRSAPDPLEKYELNFFFDWGSGCCVWAANDAALRLFGDYAVFTEQLPISAPLKAALDRLIDKHDEALDWDDPANDLLWSKAQAEAFQAEALAAYQQLCIELGGDFQVTLRGLM